MTPLIGHLFDCLIALSPLAMAAVTGAMIEARAPHRAVRSSAGRVWLNIAGLSVIAAVLQRLAAPMIAIAASYVAQTDQSLLGRLPLWLGMICGLLLLDAAEYLLHRLEHVFPVLWRLHRLHHDDDHLDCSTAFRFHPGETLLRGMAVALLVIMFGVPPLAVAIYAALVLVVDVWQHANIRLAPPSRALTWVLVTPDRHHLHHSADPAHHGRNFGVLLSIWDRMGGTYRSPGSEPLRFGLDPTERKAPVAGLVAMLRDPLT